MFQAEERLRVERLQEALRWCIEVRVELRSLREQTLGSLEVHRSGKAAIHEQLKKVDWTLTSKNQFDHILARSSTSRPDL